MKKTLKKNIEKLHLWLGLTSGLVVSIVVLTGSILVFENEIDPLINPEFHIVSSIGNSKKTFPLPGIIYIIAFYVMIFSSHLVLN
ncbi:PepSY domain-containing protein [Flavobacterium sp. FlaQc-48]|uniref:PepSY domain-containing protein n=1 Tax=Flavobacterium sp. FlaQc-48 TaxID=3374181 RepID=UPI0037571045